MNSTPKVSIIVPVYNCEKYLHQCVDSIVTQTLKEIEIILVDDGSTDGSPAICDEYAAKDSCVKVIHKKNEGMGVAYNTGMAESKGEYIGFVETDDWIEPEMYEELYAKAIEENVDVVKSLYMEHSADGSTKFVNIFGKAPYINTKVCNPLHMSRFVYRHTSHWSALYKKEFLSRDNIQFPNTPGASFQDMVFNWYVYAKMKSCFILPKGFYNYRVGLSTQSVSQGYVAAKNIVRVHKCIQEEVLRDRLHKTYKEIHLKFLYNSFLNSWKNPKRLRGFQRLAFVAAISKIGKKYFPDINFTQFDQVQKKDFLRVIHHPVWYFISFIAYAFVSDASSKKLKILGLTVYKKKIEKEEQKNYIFGICIKKLFQKKDIRKTYICGLPFLTCKKKSDKIKKYFFGICYGSEPIPQPPFAEDIHLLRVITHANAISHTHRMTFTKYKNCHAGQDVVLLGTGPSLNYFEPIKNCVYVGVNKAASYKKVHLDYIFFQDYWHPHTKDILADIRELKGTVKFYGILQEEVHVGWSIPESIALRDQAERYYVISQWYFPPVHFTYDIANEPLGCCGSVSYAALQFILWTNPRRIYLVGQDCSAGYFDHTESFFKTASKNNLEKGWREMKQFIKLYYPDIEIISINPRGLHGMFKDMYTRSYLEEHPEINVETRDVIETI